MTTVGEPKHLPSVLILVLSNLPSKAILAELSPHALPALLKADASPILKGNWSWCCDKRALVCSVCDTQFLVLLFLAENLLAIF